MSINDGGPAFPCTLDQWNDGFGGMSIRDEFAKAALAGSMASMPGGSEFPFAADVPPSNWTPESTVAKHCYMLADAMIAEREKGTEHED